MSFCPSCGSRIESNEVGCQGCGFKPTIDAQQSSGGVNLNKDATPSSENMSNVVNQNYTNSGDANNQTQYQSNAPTGQQTYYQDTQQTNQQPNQQENFQQNNYQQSNQAAGYNINQQSGGGYGNNQNPSEEKLTTWMKILIVLGTVFVPLVGIIVGVIFMNKGYGENAKFGKTLLVGTLIWIILYIVCCCFGGVLWAGIGSAFYY